MESRLGAEMSPMPWRDFATYVMAPHQAQDIGWRLVIRSIPLDADQ